MKLQFLGASRTVTGSKYLISLNGDSVMVDCGLFQGLKELRLKNWATLPLDPSRLRALILTHAHLDHSGYIPLLVRSGFKGPIYATPATRELARILLLDSGYLQEEEARFANRKGFSKHHPALPLYTREDAENCLNSFIEVEAHQLTKLSGPLEFEFIPNGHLLGSASVRLRWNGKSILFSGDIGRPSDPLMRSPETPVGADYLVMESTYGDRTHPTTKPLEELSDIIARTIKRKGTVLIPSFAVGRAQLILFFLRQLMKRGELRELPIFLNSPMAQSVNQVFCRFAGQTRLSADEARDVCSIANIVTTVEESKALNEMKGSRIIIAASGMATGGRVLHHLKTIAPDSRNTIVFAGFQAAGTRGEALVHGAEEIKIHGEMWPVRAEVVNLESLSAHADADELVDWVSRLKIRPKKVFITHGEPLTSQAMGRRLVDQLGLDATIPDLGDQVDL